MINENIISLIREKVKELGGKLPKEVEMIQDRIENQRSIGLETPEYEEDFMADSHPHDLDYGFCQRPGEQVA